jgi:hypothetical protein
LGRQGPRGCPPIPWPTCPGAKRSHKPVPWGSGPGRGGRRAARGGGSCRSRARLAPKTGGGLVVRSGLRDGELPGAQPLSVGGEQGPGDGEGRWHRGSGPARSAPSAGGVVRDLLADLGHVGVPLGMLPMGQKFRAFAPQVGAAPQEGPSGPPLGRGDRGLGEQAAAPESGNLWGIARVVFGRAAMEGLHREGVAEDNGKVVCGTQGGEPLPGAETLDGHHQLVTRGGEGREKRCRGRLHMAVQQDFPRVAQDADGHGAGMEVNATGKWVLVGGESHEVSSFLVHLSFSPCQHTTGGC